MSVSVELERVQAEAAERGPGAFLLTVTDDGRPHVVAVTVGWDVDAGTLVMSAGRTSVSNAVVRPSVSVLWPPAESGGYSLIVDGEAAASPNADGSGGHIDIAITRAVLHRPVGSDAAPTPGADASACSSDCVPLLRRA